MEGAKRINQTGPRNARLEGTMPGAVNCGKSTNTMHNTDLLEDLVGMVGLGGDDDELLDLGSTYNYGEDLQSPQFNSAAEHNFRYSAKLNGRAGKHGLKGAAWRDAPRHSNGVVRPGSSTNATLRDMRSRTGGRGKKRSMRSQDMNDDDLNSLDRDSNAAGDLDVEFGAPRRRDKARGDDEDRSRL
jgi:hypothetical protein